MPKPKHFMIIAACATCSNVSIKQDDEKGTELFCKLHMFTFDVDPVNHMCKDYDPYLKNVTMTKKRHIARVDE